MAGMSRQFKWLRTLFKITGLFILAIGVITGYGNLRGWFLYPERQEFLKWALESDVGMPIEDPSAQAFMRDFPPPEDARPEEITHVTKQVLTPASGGVREPLWFDYMLRDNSHTSYVVTFAQVRKWAEETSYPWLAWGLTLLGFLVVLATTLFDSYPLLNGQARTGEDGYAA